MGRIAGSVVALALAGFALAGCGDDDSSDATGGAGDEVPDDVVVVDDDPAAVTALDNTFQVENIQVKPGTEVVWTNGGRNEHNVLPTEGDAWGAETADFQPGDEYSATFDEPGVYRYYCSIHATKTAGMIGAVVVAE